MSDFVIVNGELRHHGVKGMKWGVRKKRRELKQQYRNRTNKAFSEYEKTIANIEKPYKRGQNLSKKDMAREAAAEKRYSDTVAKAKADYKSQTKSVKQKYKTDAKMAKQQKKENEKKIREELQEAGYKNSTGYNASKHTKNAISSGVSALGVAAVGSAATHVLAKNGKQAAAQRVYKLSRQAFDTLAFSSQVSAGMAAINVMMGGTQSVSKYRRTEKEIRAKYKN